MFSVHVSNLCIVSDTVAKIYSLGIESAANLAVNLLTNSSKACKIRKGCRLHYLKIAYLSNYRILCCMQQEGTPVMFLIDN